MNAPDKSTCPKCGTPLPADAPKALCPRCLGALNLTDETVLADVEAQAAQSAIATEELAPHFPQLEILEYLGRGGMGVVYKARQKSLNRIVALKLLAPERVHDQQFADRFAKEAQALAALNHSNIVAVHDFGQAGGYYFLLMEFVDGLNLRQLLHARKMEPAEALAIVPPLCEALQYAHERGIVHRDIKPENILLDKEGRVKVADFGIARILGNQPTAMLQEEKALGTPGYVAPEQTSDPRKADSRADIYSLGVVLYEMLTGQLPDKNLLPPSRKIQIDVRLDEVVLRALEQEPERRFQTAGEFRTRLEAATKSLGPVPPKPAAPKSKESQRSANLVIVAGTVTLFFALLEAGVPLFSSLRLKSFPLVAILAIFFPFLFILVRKLMNSVSPVVFAWTAVIATLPAAGFALFFSLALLFERGGWNPSLDEAILVPLTWIGTVLLAISAGILFRADGQRAGKPAHELRSLLKAGALSLAVAFTLMCLLGAFLFAVYKARSRTSDLALASNLERDRQMVQQNILNNLQRHLSNKQFVQATNLDSTLIVNLPKLLHQSEAQCKFTTLDLSSRKLTQLKMNNQLLILFYAPHRREPSQ